MPPIRPRTTLDRVAADVDAARDLLNDALALLVERGLMNDPITQKVCTAADHLMYAAQEVIADKEVAA